MRAPEGDLPLLIEASRVGSDVAMRHWRQAPPAWDKGGGHGPVSEADLAVDEALKRLLLGARPGYGWLSEETEDDPSRLGADNAFIVDPIDGTRSYLDGQDGWAISLAVAQAGRVVAAAVAMPAKGRIYTASAGGGAFRDAEPIRASSRTSVARARVLAPRKALAEDRWGGRGAPPVERHFRPSLAYRLCLVAEGRFDGMLTLADCWEWDIAAGALIAAEAGAVVSDARGQPLQFNSGAARTPGVIAAAAPIHQALLPRRQTS